MIASRELSARPGAVWGSLAKEGAVVITRDGCPLGIITPTSPETLLEDMQELVFSKARRAVSSIRRKSANGRLDRLSTDEIDAEIRMARKTGKKR